MSPVIPEENALARAIRNRADEAVAVFAPDGASARARARAKWWAEADRHAALLDGVIDTVRHRLDRNAPERTCAKAWRRRVCADAIERGDYPPDATSELSRILEACLPQAETLARACLDTRVSTVDRTRVLHRLAHLCAVLGEDCATWHLPLARVAALAALAQPTWRGLEHAPPWAVVLALGNTTACDLDYRRDIATLAQSPENWVAPRVAHAAQSACITLGRDPDPVRLATLLAQWPWPHAAPPLASIAAFADVAPTNIDHALWAAATDLHNDRPGQCVDAEQRVQAIERKAPNLRMNVNDVIERQARLHVEDWLTGFDRHPRTDSYFAALQMRAHDALEQMQMRWATDPRLAWHGSDADALRFEPRAPDPPRSDADAQFHGGLRPRYDLVWRVACTDLARAIVGNGGVPGLAHALAQPASFDFRITDPEFPSVDNLTSDHPHTAQTGRSAAIEAIIEYAAKRWSIET